MSKIFRLNFLIFWCICLSLIDVRAQELPEDPPTDPELPPVLTTLDLNEVDSKELFDVLNTWNLVVVDRQTQAKKLQASEVICVENMEDGRQLGCALYDDLNTHDITKYNKNADPLFKALIKHTPMDCEDESETCILSAEKINCALLARKYSCSLQVLIPQPKNKKGE